MLEYRHLKNSKKKKKNYANIDTSRHLSVNFSICTWATGKTGDKSYDKTQIPLFFIT